MAKVHVMDHPLIAHKISYIRSEEVGTKEFREMIGEIAQLMCYEAPRDLKLEDVQIKTPICEMTGKSLAGKKLAIVPILRAGLGMVDGFLTLIPAAKVSERELLEMAYQLEKQSEHPLAKAINRKAEEEQIQSEELEEFHALPGNGLEGDQKGQALLGGNIAFMKTKAVLSEELEKAAATLAEAG